MGIEGLRVQLVMMLLRWSHALLSLGIQYGAEMGIDCYVDVFLTGVVKSISFRKGGPLYLSLWSLDHLLYHLARQIIKDYML